jgi:hypothetical protein
MMKLVAALAAALLLFPQSVSADDQNAWPAAALAARPAPGSAAALVSVTRSETKVAGPETTLASSFLLAFVSPSLFFTKGEPCFGCVVPPGAKKADGFSAGLNFPDPNFAKNATTVYGTIEGTSLGFTGIAKLSYGILSGGKTIAISSVSVSIKSGYSYLWYFAFKRPALHGAKATLAAMLVSGESSSNTVETPIEFQ